ncbi:GNAT family N-acetyltransferase [Nisaea acidiphila]|uniref:GNAT family N-acetyltransferase n=1 Tax=Nisaea acidiphila TaxID=1862145 RepID=A0A9J7AVY0_9PROT|nr:GNAT family N-acetyltransferase [Nisaea acidiphila]UUX51278.1 GNAT family N-acetyltransferase [Nisaea acidiphila]
MNAMQGGPCRLARPDEIENVREVQRAAGRRFLETPYVWAAEDPVDDAAELSASQDRWHLWVSVDGQDRPVGAGHLMLLGDSLHLRELDVHPDFAGMRRGAAILNAVERFFAGRGIVQISLTTFIDVPWNAPYYQRLGFGIVPEEEMGAALRDAWLREATGFPIGKRVAMRRPFQKRGWE